MLRKEAIFDFPCLISAQLQKEDVEKAKEETEKEKMLRQKEEEEQERIR